MKHILFILVSLILVTGCATQKRCNCKFPPVQSVNDSSAVTTAESVQERDSISYLPADSSWLRALLACDENGKVIMRELQQYKSGKNTQIPEVSIVGNVLQAKCKIDSLAVFNHFSKQVKTKGEYIDRTVKNTKYVNQLSGWQVFQTKAFWPMALALMLISFLLISKILR